MAAPFRTVYGLSFSGDGKLLAAAHGSAVKLWDVASGEARNRFTGIVREVKVEGLLAQVEIHTTAPSRVVAVITREAVEELGLEPGQEATAVVKATSVLVER